MMPPGMDTTGSLPAALPTTQTSNLKKKFGGRKKKGMNALMGRSGKKRRGGGKKPY